MTRRQKNRKCSGHPAEVCSKPAPNVEVIRSLIGDAIAGSLSNTQAAAAVLQRVNGATPFHLLAAAIDLLREDRDRRMAEDDLAEKIACLEEQKTEIKAALENLLAKLGYPSGGPDNA
jgi:hypothetical protein